MPEEESLHERELGGQLLASVSRSFYLTLKALPAELREPISLAYLLARTADTLADTATAPAELRLQCLDEFEMLILSNSEAKPTRQRLTQRIQQSFVQCQQDQAERRLMERFSDGLDWLSTMRGASLNAIQNVLRHIIHGQRLDIQRFPADGTLHCLCTDAELEEYTWLVAGCVGEFWTEMCALEKPDALAPAVSLAHLQQEGAKFGQGLQLINILRDIGEDVRDGRCYLPGFSAEDIRQNPRLLEPAWDHWWTRCHQHLESGLSYVTQVADARLRYATALPLLIGVRTLARMKSASWQQRLVGIKISRLDVAKILAEAAISCRTADGVRRLFQKLS